MSVGTCLLVVAFGIWALTGPLAQAAGRSDGARERRSAERPEHTIEMRRQMQEYQRHWRASPALDARPVTPLPGSAAPLAPGVRSDGQPGRGRLNNDERDQLRQQLRQAPRFEAPRDD